MSERDLLTAELRDVILTDLVPLEADELHNDTPLVDNVLDSLGIAELAVFIEDLIGRTLRAEEETRSTFASIDSIVEFISANR
ncbi:hypothetical protein [uncultured Microbacterium sp.]|uniref:hypothetical protein n=1 Tax=uncultured Microbacterium sp. TaxID=191216 RepID=UPI00261EFF05|nr:hypothetical protein [uncultured Microbacterium sp.]